MNTQHFAFTRRNWRWMGVLFLMAFAAFIATGSVYVGILGAGGLLYVFVALLGGADDQLD